MRKMQPSAMRNLPGSKIVAAEKDNSVLIVCVALAVAAVAAVAVVVVVKKKKAK